MSGDPHSEPDGSHYFGRVAAKIGGCIFNFMIIKPNLSVQRLISQATWQHHTFKLTREVISVETWVSFITEVGFPIMVTFYLLHRIEGKLNDLIASIHALPEKMK